MRDDGPVVPSGLSQTTLVGVGEMGNILVNATKMVS